MSLDALYIHIPFCKKKCAYCDFNSYENKDDLMLDFAIALSKEIDDLPKYCYDTIYIGGGTPTYLSVVAWKTIKESIDRLNLSDNCEFSVEGNPGTFSKEKLLLFKDMGINRLSIGVQALDDTLLNSLGRIHTVEDVMSSFALSRKLGFNNINLDLMFGIPKEDIAAWKDTLIKAVALKPEHISCYSLIVEEETKFYSQVLNGGLKLPEEDEEREMYSYGIDYLFSQGYSQYEISNFSREGFKCNHNIKYWEMKEYISCGPGASSYFNKTRYRNVAGIEQYINIIKNEKSPRLLIQENTVSDEMEEFVFMGLRKTDGISKEKFKDNFKQDIFSVYPKILYKHLNSGLLVQNKNNIYLSRKGVDISNFVMSDFIIS